MYKLNYVKALRGKKIGLWRMAQRGKLWNSRARIQALQLNKPVFDPKSDLN